MNCDASVDLDRDTAPTVEPTPTPAAVVAARDAAGSGLRVRLTGTLTSKWRGGPAGVSSI